MLVVVAILDHRAQPADELPPAEPASAVAAVAIPEPGGREHRCPVVVEDVDLVVVESDNDLELRVVVEVADADVLAVGAVAVVAVAVEVGVVALAGQRVEPGPRRRRSTLRPVDGALRVEHEHLRSGRRGVRRRHDDLDPAVPVEIGSRHAPRLGTLAAAARRRGPAGLEPQASRRGARTPRPFPRCRRRRSRAPCRRRGRQRRRARRRDPSSPSPCRADDPWRRTRTWSRTARRSRAARRR